MDYIVYGIILLILCSAIGYIIKEKKRGAKCIGCSLSGSCGSSKKSGCGEDNTNT